MTVIRRTSFPLNYYGHSVMSVFSEYTILITNDR